MAKTKKAESKTLIKGLKVERSLSEYVKTESGLFVGFIRGVAGGPVTKVAVRDTEGIAGEVTLAANDLIQAYKIFKEMDGFNNFVCENHGSFKASGGRQNAKCESCHRDDMSSVSAKMVSEAVYEQEDQ